MNEKNNYLRIGIYCIAILGFIDLIINPKPIEYLNSGFNIITSSIIICGLILLLFRKRLRLKNQISQTTNVIVLILILFYINIFLKHFNFVQSIEFIIVAIYALPLIFVLKELIPTNIKSKYLALLGIVLLIPTLIYFNFIYEPYEDYWNEIPIIFIHNRIRNWIYFLGILFLLVSVNKVKENN